MFSCRENLVKDLSRYIQVDIYGGCGTLKCVKEKENTCNQMMNQTYKFYLSLENSVCQVFQALLKYLLNFFVSKDYVTEKYFKVLPFNVIPIVLNGANMSRIAPPHSYINVQALLCIL